MLLTLELADAAQTNLGGCPTFPISATNETELKEAITCFNTLTTGTYAVNLTTAISLTTSTIQINNNIANVDLVISGGTNIVDGQGLSGVRPFTIAPDTTVLMQAITLTNDRSSQGGGIHNQGHLDLIDVVLTSNTAVTATGGISLTTGSSAYVLNTIVANSTGGDCAGPGSFNDSRYNIFEDGSCISDPTSISGDPCLAPLADNSGVPGILNQLPTHALLTLSPALDAIPSGQNTCGSSTEDQRGIPRPKVAVVTSGPLKQRFCHWMSRFQAAAQ